MNIANNISDSLIFLWMLLLNFTILAICMGRGIYKIGMAKIKNEVIVEKSIVDLIRSEFFTRVEVKRKLRYIKATCQKCNTAYTITICEKYGANGRLEIVANRIGNTSFHGYKCTKCGTPDTNYKCKSDDVTIEKFEYV